MDKQRRSRYLLAVYLLVTFGAVTLLLLGLNYTKDPTWQSVWINLATGLLGVALLFFLVDRFFLADEWRLTDRIEQLVNQQEMADNPSAEKFFTKKPELSEYIKSAKKIRMCGVSLTGTINGNIGYLRDCLKQGTTVELMLADPRSLALKMSAARSEKPDDIEYYNKRLESAFKDIGFLYETSQAMVGATQCAHELLSVRLLSYAPSFYMCQFEEQDGSQVIHIELYPHGPIYAPPPMFRLTPEKDGRWFEFFSRQFDNMWLGAKPWVPELLTANLSQYDYHRRQALASAPEFFSNQRHVPNDLLEHAKVIAISGFTLSRTLRNNLLKITQCLSNGGKLRVMILDPDENLLQECAKRSHGRTTAAHWRKRLDSTVSHVEVIANSPDITGSVSLGRLPFLPSFGMVMVDPDTEHGVISVELYHHRSAEDNPTFELYADRDQNWYRFFRQQFESMWSSCSVEEYPRAQ